MTKRTDRPWIRCEALMVNGFQCGSRAKWWVRRPTSTVIGRGSAARCGLHARAYVVTWPMVTGDMDRDQALAEGVFV